MQLIGEALTFDDVLLVPAHSTVLPRDVEISTRLSRNLRINIPLLSAAMDTVTEAAMAICMAQEGGIGIIHKNMSPEQQAAQVRRVKKFEAGVIKDPIVTQAQASIREVLLLMASHGISGVPVVGADGRLEGIVTNRDLRFETRMDAPVSSVMTPRERLVTVAEGSSLDTTKNLLHKHRIEKILVVNDAFELRGLITVKDISKATAHPNACRDSLGRLLVGAAVGVGVGTEERVERLVEAGVDLIIVDTAHGHSQGVLDRVAWVKKHFPQVDVIGGNIATGEAARALVEAGADGVKVGIGPGSICTTRMVAGVGVPQVTAIINVAEALRGTDVPLVADGGVRFSGDFAKALAAGAHTVMVGGLLAGTDEAPGEIELYQGRSFKAYRGMGSLGAMQQGSADRYFQDTSNPEGPKLVPEGVEGRVPYKGPAGQVIHQLLGGLRSSMGYLGASSLEILARDAKFVKITQAGVRESHVHDVHITKEAPNYRVE